MTYKICYWDSELGEQAERDSTPEEDAQQAADIAASAVILVPQTVTMRQARLALLGAGLLAQVSTEIAALPSPQKESAEIEWEFSSEVHRNKPFVIALGAALGLTEQQLDNLFITAATL